MGRARRVASRRRDRSIDRSIEGRDATASDASDRARVGANDDGDGDDERERCRAVVARGRSGTNADERGMDGGWEARVRERWGAGARCLCAGMRTRAGAATRCSS